MMSAFSSRHAADGPRAHCPEWVIVNDQGWQIIFTNRREDSDPLDPPEPTAPAPARGPSQRGRLGAQKVHTCRGRRTDGGGGQQGGGRHLLAAPRAAR